MKRPPSPHFRLLAAAHKGPGLPGPLSFWGTKSGPRVPRRAFRSGIESAAQLSHPCTDPARVARFLGARAAGAGSAPPGAGSCFPHSRRAGPGPVIGCPPPFGRDPSARSTHPAARTALPVKRVVRPGRGLRRDRNKLTSMRSDAPAPRGLSSMVFLVGIVDATVDRRPLTRSSLSAPGCDPGRVTSALLLEAEATVHAGVEAAAPVTRAGSRAGFDHFLAQANPGTPAASFPDDFVDPARVSPRRDYGLCRLQLPDVPGHERGPQDEPSRRHQLPVAVIPARDPARVTSRQPLKSTVRAAGHLPCRACATAGWTGLVVTTDVKDRQASGLAALQGAGRRPDLARVTLMVAGLTLLAVNVTARAVAGMTRPGSCPTGSRVRPTTVGRDPARVTRPLAADGPTELAALAPDAKRPTRPGSPPTSQPGRGRIAPPTAARHQGDVAGEPPHVTRRPGVSLPAGGRGWFAPGDRGPAQVALSGPHRELARSGARIPMQPRSAAGHATSATRYFTAAVKAVRTGRTPTPELLTRPGSCPILSIPLGSPRHALARRGALARDPARVTPSTDGGAAMT